MRTEEQIRAEVVKDIITRLAKLPCPCPNEALCEGCYMDQLEAKGEGATWPREKHTQDCVCKGTGARFPWLWKPCQDCKDGFMGRCENAHWFYGHYVYVSGVCRLDGKQIVLTPCPVCEGRGWVLRPDIPLEDAIAQALPDYHGLRRGVLDWASHLPVLNSDQTVAPERVRLLFWQAMEKAVSHE